MELQWTTIRWSMNATIRSRLKCNNVSTNINRTGIVAKMSCVYCCELSCLYCYSYLVCIVVILCVFVVQCVHCCFYFRCRTYLLTPWSRVLLEKLASLQLFKKFPAFYGTRRFLTALTSARHLSLS